MSEELLDCLGRRRSPAATSTFHAGRPPRNRGLRYPADPPPEEIVAVMRAPGPGAYDDRCGRSSWCYVVPGCGSVRHSRWRRPILILPAGPCWSAPGRAANAARSA